MARVLLLNPPAPGRTLLRDFACGETAKADYCWAPIDLLVLSGVLSGHELSVLDAVAEALPADAALARARAARPEVVFTLVAAVSLAQDQAFLHALKQATGARVYALGDVASFEPARTLDRAPALDGTVQDFAEPSLDGLAQGRLAQVQGVVLRGADGRPDWRPPRADGLMRYPRPQHALFPLHRYRLPFSRWQGCTSVLTVYGCPFPCTFCPSNALPYQLRPLPDVLDELQAVRRLGVREVFLRDFTFGPTRRRAVELCEGMAALDLGIGWTAECRLEVLDEDLLARMRRAGCEVIMCGVEVGDPEVSQRLGKRQDLARASRLLAEARRLGIRTCGHFVLGSPGETAEQLARTAALARSLPMDYAAFNLYAPRLGTPMRAELVAQGRVDAEDFGEQDVSVAAQRFAAVDGPTLRRHYIRAVLGFYLRPRHAARLLAVTPWSTLGRQGLGVLRNVASSRA